MKNMVFQLKIKVDTQGVSLWYFLVYMYITPIGLAPLIFFILP
jgi:hypothetical protein